MDGKNGNNGIQKSILPSCLSLPLSPDVLRNIIPSIKDFALLNGAGMRYKDRYDPDILEIAPFFLLPSPFPRRDFEDIIEIQPVINLLMHKVAHDYDFLHSCLKRTIEVDDFTARLWNIYETVRKEGIAQEVSLGLLRSDVMLSECDPITCVTCESPPYISQYQVEVNSIAAGFGHLGPISAEIHRFVLKSLRRNDLLNRLPVNHALKNLCSGMIQAFDFYNAPDAIILFLVENITFNICDQRFHEFEIMNSRPDIRVIRRTLTDIARTGRLETNRSLIVDDMEIAVVYFRCGYEPLQYPTEAEWDARLMIERSRAIKSPSIYYHLAGAKKVQQELARPGILEKFLDADVAKRVSVLFTGLYSLDFGETGDRAIEMAMKNPEKFVLKPQREGGGNNIYGVQIKEVLERIRDTSEREAYILMDRIYPPIQQNYLVRSHQEAKLEDIVSELGIFGVILGSENEIFTNEFAGHMLRSKLSTVNEGGVAAGHGALDSVFLVD